MPYFYRFFSFVFIVYQQIEKKVRPKEIKSGQRCRIITITRKMSVEKSPPQDTKMDTKGKKNGKTETKIQKCLRA